MQKKATDLDQIMWGNPCSVKFINCIGGSNSARHMTTIAAVNKIWGQTAILTYILKVSFFLASSKLCACKNLFRVITLWRLLPVIAPVFFYYYLQQNCIAKKKLAHPQLQNLTFHHLTNQRIITLIWLLFLFFHH